MRIIDCLQVIVYAIDPFSQSLSKVAAWGGSFIAISLAPVPSHPSQLVVADALRSLTLLEFTSDPNKSKLEEVSRHYDPHYMSALTAVSESEFLGAESDLNLFTVMRETMPIVRNGGRAAAAAARSGAGPTEETVLSSRGGFHLGEYVSRFRSGALVQQLGGGGGNAQQATTATAIAPVAVPKSIFTTSAGSLGVVLELSEAASKTLSNLERNMRAVISTVADLRQEDFRAFRTARGTVPSAGFVDGDFVERFLGLGEEEGGRVMEGKSEFERLEEGRGDVMKLVEECARLH